MNSKPTLREQIDACRADHHDLQRAELTDLSPLAREAAGNAELQRAVEQSERFDRSVRAAFDDVTLPAGLADRLLAGCEAALVSPAASAAPVAEEAIPTKQSARRFNRRLALALFSAAASLLIAVIGGWSYVNWAYRTRPVSNDMLALQAMNWFDQCGPAAQWSNAAAPTKSFPLDRALVYRPVRWRFLNDERDTVVYEMKHESQRALLFVFKPQQPHPQLLKVPYSRLSASGGIALGAWKRGEYVYVLAVSGGHGQRPLDSFVRPPKSA